MSVSQKAIYLLLGVSAILGMQKCTDEVKEHDVEQSMTYEEKRQGFFKGAAQEYRKAQQKLKHDMRNGAVSDITDQANIDSGRYSGARRDKKSPKSGAMAGITGSQIRDTAGPNSTPYPGERPLIQADSGRPIRVTDTPKTKEGWNADGQSDVRSPGKAVEVDASTEEVVVGEKITSTSSVATASTQEKEVKTYDGGARPLPSVRSARPLPPVQSVRQIEQPERPVEPPKTTGVYVIDPSRFGSER